MDKKKQKNKKKAKKAGKKEKIPPEAVSKVGVPRTKYDEEPEIIGVGEKKAMEGEKDEGEEEAEIEEDY